MSSILCFIVVFIITAHLFSGVFGPGMVGLIASAVVAAWVVRKLQPVLRKLDKKIDHYLDQLLQ